MDRLVQSGSPVAHGGGGQQADGAGDHRRLIGENVAEHVLRYDNVKLAGVPDDLHGAVVHQHVLVGHVGVFLRQTVHDGAPQAAGLQHVGLVHAGHLFPAQPGHFKGAAADALDLHFGVSHQVGTLHPPVRRVVAIALAEVDAAGQLPDHHQVDALFGGLLFQRAGVRQRGTQGGGTQIGVQAQILPDGQQRRFRPLLGGLVTAPLGAAHSAQKYGVAVPAQFRRAVGVALAHRVGGAAAQQHVHVLKGVAEPLPYLVDDADRFVDDLRADAVAPDQCNLELHFAIPLAFRLFSRPPFSMMPLTNSGKGAA